MRLLVSSHPHFLMFVCTCLYPRILTSSYLQVVWSLEITYMFDIFDWLISSHSQILISLGSCAFSCILASSHPHILVCVYLLVSSHPYILVSSGSYPLSCILIGSGSCALACILASSHPHMLRLMCASMLISSGQCVLDTNNCILAFSSSLVLGNCVSQVPVKESIF